MHPGGRAAVVNIGGIKTYDIDPYPYDPIWNKVDINARGECG